MLQILFESASVFIFSAFNLYYGFALSITYDQNALEQILFMVGGSLFGIVGSIFFGKTLQMIWQTKIQSRRKGITAQKKDKPNFITKVWQKYGLWGLAFCTGFIGTIPVVMAALLSGIHRNKIVLYLGTARVAWTLFYVFIGQRAINHIIALIF